MSRTTFATDLAPAPVGPYSQAARVDNLVAIAGQVGVNASGEVPEGVDAQTRQAFDNISAILAEAGGDLDDVIQVRVFLVNKDDFVPMNAAYSDYFDTSTPPVRTTIYVGLPRDFVVEIDALAVIDDRNQDDS